MVTLVFSLLTTRILSQHFSIHDYGTYSQIILVTSTVSSLTIFGMVDGVNYFFCKEANAEKRDSYISTIFSLQCIVSLIASVIVLSCTVPISNYFNNSDIKGLIIFAAILPVMQNMISLLQIMFIAIGKAKHIGVRNLLVSISKLIAIVLACYLFNNVVFILICQLILDVAQVLYFAVSLNKKGCGVKTLRLDRSLIKEIFKYCIPMAMFTVIKSLNKDCDKYVVAAFTNTETLAIYTNASKQLPFDIIMTSFCTVLLPYITRFIAQKDFVRTRTVYKSFLELSYICTTVLAFAAICTAPELMSFLYSDKYISGLNIFIVYIIVDILSVLNITLILSAAGKTKSIMCISAGAFVLNLVLNIAFYHLFDLIGPAIATLVVTTIQGVIMLSFGAKEMGTNILEMFNKRFAFLFILELVTMGIITYGARLLFLKLSLPSFVILCMCCFVYVSPLVLLNFKRLKNNIKVINSCKA